MRVLVLVLLAGAAVAQPPEVKDFRRLRKFRDDIASEIVQFKEAEEFALKPREEKILIAYDKGDKKFENKSLTGPLVLETCFLKWDQVQQAEPSEAAKRVLAKLPDVFFKKYAQAIEVSKRERKSVSLDLVDALDSDYLHVRACAFDALKKMYRTPSGFMYVETMDKKGRQDAIKLWRKFVLKQN
jgi:hypothetical protein